jgi:hypothetical protein
MTIAVTVIMAIAMAAYLSFRHLSSLYRAVRHVLKGDAFACGFWIAFKDEGDVTIRGYKALELGDDLFPPICWYQHPYAPCSATGSTRSVQLYVGPNGPYLGVKGFAVVIRPWTGATEHESLPNIVGVVV